MNQNFWGHPLLNAPLYFLGSLPFQQVDQSIDFVKEHSSHLPFLPQLPEANPQEDMSAQLLRGIELGYLDSEASSCLESFQNEFVESPRVKIQVVGPYTLGRTMSGSVEEVLPQWLHFWVGFVKQLKQAGFRQELWLQLDEPLWDAKRPLPENYPNFLRLLHDSRSHLRVGIHSCAPARPKLTTELKIDADFFSLNFVDQPLKPKEEEEWREYLGKGKALVAGRIKKGGEITPFPLSDEFPETALASTVCGLYDWTEEEIKITFQRLKKA